MGRALVRARARAVSRGAILLDYNYQHAYGLGYPRNADGGGPTCGQVGYGIVFAGYNPQITYNTPVFAGLQITAGLIQSRLSAASRRA